MEGSFYYTYITTNLLENNKAYVGMTNGNNKNYMGSCNALLSDIKRLGVKNFQKTILGKYNNWQECHYWEGYYIRTLNTHISQGGYNEKWDGGNYTIMPKIAREKMAKKMKGKYTGIKRTEEAKEKNAEKHRGKKQSPETIAKRVAKRIGKKQSPETIEKRRPIS